MLQAYISRKFCVIKADLAVSRSIGTKSAYYFAFIPHAVHENRSQKYRLYFANITQACGQFADITREWFAEYLRTFRVISAWFGQKCVILQINQQD